MKTETAEQFYFSWKETPEGKDVWNRYGPDEISSIAIAFAEAYVSRASSKAAEAPGGQDARLERAAKRIAENWTLNTQTYSSVWREEKILDILKEELAAPAALSERDLRNILTRLIEFLARPYQEGGRGMADSSDSELSKLLRELRAAPSERVGFVEWYAKWPKGRPTSDGLTVPEIIEAAEAYAEYAQEGE